MDSILYMMHIDWNWIKQRPQFIAEGLSKKYKVNVIYKHTYRKNGYQKEKNSLDNITLNEVYSFPNRLNKYGLFNHLNTELFKQKVKQIIKKDKPKCIYITAPALYKAIPQEYKGKIIYDCMDDHLALEANGNFNDYSVKYENKLLHRADNIIITSNHLKKTIISRYGKDLQKKIVIIRNGFAGEIINNKKQIIRKPYKFVYFGTISHWIDFSLLEKSLRDFPEIEYNFYGPVDKSVNVPQNPRIKFLGTIEHKELYKKAASCKALIMPFKLNDIVESVDPVKLYEYINFDKNILTIKYSEIERFKQFVYFYSSYDEYKAKLQEILKENNVKYNSIDRIKFLKNNSWSSRVDKIIKIIG